MDINEFFSQHGTEIIGGIFFIVGLILVLAQIKGILKSGTSKAWPTIHGKVLRSRVHISRSRSSSTNRNSGLSVSYRPDIEFVYKIDGIEYHSKRPYYGSNIGSSFKYKRSKDLVDKYPVGKEVKVYYNPGNPKEAILETGLHRELFLGLGMGILFSIIGYFVYSFLQ